MAEVTIAVDVSGSMSVLGKKEICKNLCQTLNILLEIWNEFSDWNFNTYDWDGTLENLQQIIGDNSIGNEVTCKNIIVLTDGFALFDNCKTYLEKIVKSSDLKLAVVLCGGDSKRDCMSKSVNVFESIDIVKAAEYFLNAEKTDAIV